MDCRHPLKPLDRQMLQWCTHLDLPVHVLLTKSDKLKKGPAKNTLLKVRQMLKEYENVSVQLFSSLKKTGIDEAHHVLGEWFGLEDV